MSAAPGGGVGTGRGSLLVGLAAKMKTDISMIAAACLEMMQCTVVVDKSIQISSKISDQCCQQYQSIIASRNHKMQSAKRN